MRVLSFLVSVVNVQAYVLDFFNANLPSAQIIIYCGRFCKPSENLNKIMLIMKAKSCMYNPVLLNRTP